MEYDAVPHALPPAPSRRVSDLRSTYADLTREGLRLMSEKLSNDPAYSSNESGHFAWDVSLMIRAACLAWKYSGDVTHLEQAIAWSQHVVDRTDAARGLVDWRGRSGPVWSAGSRYTAGTIAVGGTSGLPVTLQAAASTVTIERPRPNTAIIHAIREDGTEWTSPEASLDPSSENYLPDVLARKGSIHCVLVRGLNTPIALDFLPAGNFAVSPQHAPHLVHTGMIARALIETADTLEDAVNPPQITDITPKDLYAAARDALTHHDDELRIQRAQTWYITPDDFPGRRLGVDLPHNHVADVSTSFLRIGRYTGEEAYRQLGASLAQPWLEEISRFESGTLPHPWFYYPEGGDAFTGVTRRQPISEREVPAVPREEDSSHATIRVRALRDWHATDPALVGAQTLKAIAGSLRRNFVTKHRNAYSICWLPRNTESGTETWRLGYADSYPGAWTSLSPWDPSIKRIVNSLAFRRLPDRIFGATIMSAAEITALNTRKFRSGRSAPRRR